LRRIDIRLLFLVPALAAGPAFVSACLRTPPPPADLILTNAVVRPFDGKDRSAVAIAVRAGRVQKVGGADAVLQLKGADTRVFDLRGATVIPGMINAHGHLPGLGETFLNQATGESLYVDLSSTQSEEDAVQRLRARARALPPGQWILGKDWNEALWVRQELPTKRLLTEIIRYHPAFLLHADGQTVWVNQKALDAGGIGGATPEPPGGRIVREPRSREPSGILTGSAWEPVLRTIPPLEPEESSRAIVMALERLAAMGYTMVQSRASAGRLGLDDTGAPAGGMVELFRRLAIGGHLPIRVSLLIPAPSPAAEALLERGPETGIGEGRLDIRTLDLLADGTIEGRTAALLQPYADDPSHAGMLRLSPEEIAAWARRALESDIQVAVSATGDAAVQAATAGLSAALGGRSGVEARFRIEHPALISADDLRQLAAVDAIATIDPRALLSLADGGVVTARLGEERAKRAYGYGAMLAGGIHLAGSSAAGALADHPLAGIHLAMTGSGRGGRSGGRGTGDRLGRSQALALYTTGAAWAARREQDAGTIEAGKWADFTVLSGDILSLPEDEIPAIEVLATFVGGREVYLRKPFPEP
jgi:hypothetical protein